MIPMNNKGKRTMASIRSAAFQAGGHRASRAAFKNGCLAKSRIDKIKIYPEHP
jgi:hypothetical protein